MSTPNASAPASSAPIATPVTEGAPAAPSGNQQAQPAAAAAKTYSIKVDGQDFQVTEAEMITLAQQGKSAGKRFQEAATTRKEAEQIIKFAKENPKEFFAKTGMNARQWAEDFLLEQIQREQMTPEQKKAFENESELKRYKDQEKAAQEKAHADQMAQLEQQHMKSFDETFVKALNESGLPKTAYTVKRMAELTLINTRKQLDLTPSQLAKLVREDYINEQKALYEHADGDTLMEMLGKEAIKKLSKAQLSKYKAAKVNNATPQRAAEKPNTPAKSVSNWKEFTKKNRTFF